MTLSGIRLPASFPSRLRKPGQTAKCTVPASGITARGHRGTAGNAGMTDGVCPHHVVIKHITFNTGRRNTSSIERLGLSHPLGNARQGAKKALPPTRTWQCDSPAMNPGVRPIVFGGPRAHLLQLRSPGPPDAARRPRDKHLPYDRRDRRPAALLRRYRPPAHCRREPARRPRRACRAHQRGRLPGLPALRPEGPLR